MVACASSGNALQRMLRVVVLLALAWGTGAWATEVPFSARVAIEMDSAGDADWQDASAADLDRDGDLDVIAVTATGDEVAWWQSTAGDGSAWTKHTALSLDGACSAQVVDMNGDSRPDILYASEGAAMGWYMWAGNTGDGVIWMPMSSMSGVAAGTKSVRAADIDGDGDLDVVATNETTNELAWWRNDSAAMIWTKHVVTTGLVPPRAIELVDMDDDGSMDILAAGGDMVLWYDNLFRDGSFWMPYAVGSAGLAGACAAQAVDIDRDGDPRCPCRWQSDSGAVTWFENTLLAWQWTAHTIDAAFDGVTSVWAAEYGQRRRPRCARFGRYWRCHHMVGK